MKKSKTLISILPALLDAQKELEGVAKDGTNPFFKSGYTSLNATIEACKEVLNKHEIVALQPLESDADGVYVCTTLLHISGEYISSRMAIRESKTNDPQSQGSAITYARRYSLKSMLLMSDQDDDGEKAQSSYRKPEPKKDPDWIEQASTKSMAANLSGKCEICNAPNGKPHATDCTNEEKD